MIMTYYSIASVVHFLYIFVVAFINHHQELHILPPYEYCIRSEIHADLTKVFSFFYVPTIAVFFITFFLNSNIWQRPYSTHENLKDIYSAIFAQTSIKSSALTFLIIFITLSGLLLTKWLQLSVNGLGLIIYSFILPLLIVKGPCMASWTYQTEVNNFEKAQHDLMVLKLELQYKPSQMEENDEEHNGPESQKD